MLPAESSGMNRRDALCTSGLGLLGVGLSEGLRSRPTTAHAAGRSLREAPAKAVVFIFQSGGPSQHETFDPKPDAPAEIRGDYGAIQTRLAGIHFCEHLPKLAAHVDRFSLVRTMHHTAHPSVRNEHSSCHYLLHTGSTELPEGDTNATIISPRPGRNSWPSIGAMLAYAAPSAANVGWPAVIEIPRGNLMSYPGREPGLLGPRYARWGVDLAPTCRAKDAAGSCPNCFSHDDPNDPARAPGPSPQAWWDNSSCRHPEFHLPELGSTPGLPFAQLCHRTELLRQFDHAAQRGEVGQTPEIAVAWDAYREQALRLVSASRPGQQNPFDLTQESERTRGLYGREEWGQGFLVARRLVEAGVRMVQINLRGWDTHQNAFRDLKSKLLPSIDHCLSGFLDDLADRGLLDQTLVVMCGEMGRTPRISPITVGGMNASGEVFTPGRHHWGDVFPCFFAGGGIEPGRVVGTTDRQGGLPTTEAFTPADLAATIFHLLGIPSDREFRDAAGRPHRIYRGTPIQELL
jgi:hypothetical protein